MNDRPVFISVTFANGQRGVVNVGDIVCIEPYGEGSQMLLRVGHVLHLRDSVGSFSRLNAGKAEGA